MKVLNILLVIALINLSSLYAQQYQFKDSLEIVYLNSKESPSNTVFEQEMDLILQKENYNIRKEIRSLRKSNDSDSRDAGRLVYLKNLKRTANRTDNPEKFEQRVYEFVPELDQDFINQVKLNLIYEIIRRDTFNGRLDALPSVL